MTETPPPADNETPPATPAEAENPSPIVPGPNLDKSLGLRPALTVRAPSAETLWAEIVVAVNYLTRFNLSLRSEPKPRLIRKAMTWFPLIGAAIGLFGASVDWVMAMIGLPAMITATFAVISMLWITRAMHEEEFATLANQYGRGFDQAQKVGWVQEERAVQYGTLGVIFVIIMKIGAIASLSSSDLVFQALLVSSCWSRALMVVMASWLRPIQGDAVADYFQQPPPLRMLLALGIGGILTLVALGSYAGLALGVGAGAGLLVMLVGANHVRGYNGPLLGALQQVVELAILGMMLAVQ